MSDAIDLAQERDAWIREQQLNQDEHVVAGKFGDDTTLTASFWKHLQELIDQGRTQGVHKGWLIPQEYFLEDDEG